MTQTKTVYQVAPDGTFAGATVAHESPLEPGTYLLPAGAVEAPPPTVAAGERARWTGTEWRVEAEPAPEPEPEPDPDAGRSDEILARLRAIDRERVRPVSELLSSAATPEQKDYAQQRLDELEAEAQALRSELATLA